MCVQFWTPSSVWTDLADFPHCSSDTWSDPQGRVGKAKWKTPEEPPGEAGTAELGAATRDVKVRAVQPAVFPLTLPVPPVQRMSGFEEPTVDHCGPSQMVAQCSGYSGCMFSMSSSVWWYAVIRLVDAFPSVPVGKDHEKQFVSRQGW